MTKPYKTIFALQSCKDLRWCLGIHLHQQARLTATLAWVFWCVIMCSYCQFQVFKYLQILNAKVLKSNKQKNGNDILSLHLRPKCIAGMRRTRWLWPMEVALGYFLHWPTSDAKQYRDPAVAKMFILTAKSVHFEGSCLLRLSKWQQPVVLYHDISTLAHCVPL